MDGVREKNGPHSVELSLSEPLSLPHSPFLLTSTSSFCYLLSLLNWSFLLLFPLSLSPLSFPSLPSLTQSFLPFSSLSHSVFPSLLFPLSLTPLSFPSLPSLTHSTLLPSPAVLVQTNPCSLQPPSLLPSPKRFLPALLSTLSTTPTSTAFSLPQ